MLLVAFLICYRYSGGWETDWLLWKQRYDESPLSATALEGIMQRAELLAVGFVLTFAALSLVPKRRSWTTRLGGRTFYCYLLHGYVIVFLTYQFELFDRIEKFGVGAVIGMHRRSDHPRQPAHDGDLRQGLPTAVRAEARLAVPGDAPAGGRPVEAGAEARGREGGVDHAIAGPDERRPPP